MAQLQYIGARYVPIWYHNSVDDSANWEVNVEYEPLTWVTTPNNHLYLSKKTVPDNIGTPAQNTAYWLDMGVIGGDLQSIQDQIDAIVANIGDLSDLDTTDKSSIVAAINEVAQGGGGQSVKTRAIYLGNSYAQGVGSTSGTDGLFNKTKNLFDAATLYADGGVGFLTYPNHTVTFETLLDRAIADTSFDKSEVTDIIILSAWGDNSALYDNQTTFDSRLESALTSFKTKVAANYTNPKLRIRVALVECRSRRNIADTAIGTSLYESVFNTHWHLERVLKNNDIEYVGWVGFNCMMNGTYTSSDYYHPSDLGYSHMAQDLKNALTGGFTYVPLMGYCEYKCPGLRLPNNGGIAQIIQTPYETRMLITQFSSAAGSSPTQYTETTLFVYYDDDLTHLSPVKVNTGDRYLGNIKLYLPIESTSIEWYAVIKRNQYGQVSMEGQSFSTAITMTARQNNSMEIKNLIIDHFN